MNIDLAAVGRLKAGPETELCARYLERAGKVGRPLGFQGFSVVEIPESRAGRAADRLLQEEEGLLKAAEKGGFVICLDPAGELLDSEGLAAELSSAAMRATARIIFIVGGPDGIGDRLRSSTDRLLSFGRVTWPHQLARVLLAEQLYRAMTILSGHPYHRA